MGCELLQQICFMLNSSWCLMSAAARGTVGSRTSLHVGEFESLFELRDSVQPFCFYTRHIISNLRSIPTDIPLVLKVFEWFYNFWLNLPKITLFWQTVMSCTNATVGSKQGGLRVVVAKRSSGAL